MRLVTLIPSPAGVSGATQPVRRVIIVVLDGLRADAIDAIPLRHLQALKMRSAWTADGQTVAPSVTAAAMGSLLTGVPPRIHGLESDRFAVPTPRGPIHPLPAQVRAAGLPAAGFVRRVPWLMTAVARGLARMLGFTRPIFGGDSAFEILDAARDLLATQRHGLIVLHWPDADNAGHAHGWMSLEYRAAAMRLDAALGELVERANLDEPGGTCLIALADHGGGGIDSHGHDSDHRLDRTIPIMLTGAGIVPGPLGDAVSLLDVPATALALLGIPCPVSYHGRTIGHSPVDDVVRAA
jgi:hypothetical protein